MLGAQREDVLESSIWEPLNGHLAYIETWSSPEIGAVTAFSSPRSRAGRN